MRCERCNRELAEVQTKVGGQVLTMGSCARCSQRYWRLGDQVVDLTDALAAVGSTARQRGRGARSRARPREGG